MKKVANLVFNSFTNDSRVEKTSKSLIKNGFYVEVIAHGDKNLKYEDYYDGYKIKRFSYLDRKITKDTKGKIYAYLIYVYKSINYCKSFDIIHCNDLNTVPIAFLIKKFFNKNIKIIYDAHEYESERCHFSKFQNNMAKIIEGFLIKYVNIIITVSNSIAEDYRKIYGIKKPYIVYNSPPFINVIKYNIFREKFNIPQNHTIFLYQGGFGIGRGILEFYELIKNKENVSYVIMGYGYLEDIIKEKSKQEKNLYFQEAVPQNILLNYTSSADIGVCIEENLCKSWDYALPNKLFEYNMAKLPVIVSGLYEMKKFVKKNDTGFIIENIYDKNEFDNLYSNIIETYKEKINNIKKSNLIYNWEEQEKILINIYKKYLY